MVCISLYLSYSMFKNWYSDFAEIEKQDEQISVDFKSCVKTSEHLGMVSIEKINRSSLIKWKSKKFKNISIVSLEKEDLVYVLTQNKNQEIIVVKYNKVSQRYISINS